MTTTSVYINNAQIINQQINNILNEIKRYKQHLRQLNKLLDDTVDIYDELKALQHTYNTTGMCLLFFHIFRFEFSFVWNIKVFMCVCVCVTNFR